MFNAFKEMLIPSRRIAKRNSDKMDVRLFIEALCAYRDQLLTSDESETPQTIGKLMRIDRMLKEVNF